MEMVGAGLASFAFWGFIAAVVVAGVWDGAKKRDAQHETLRRMIEGGKPVDENLMKTLMTGEPKHPARDLAISAIILFSVATGMAVLALVLRDAYESVLTPLMGAAGLVACIAAGLSVASAYVKRARAEDAARASQRTHTG
jgi:hypothetical protein